MRIHTQELKDVFTKIHDFCIDAEIDYVDIPVDYYWNIPKEEVYRLQKPTKLDVGQLTDDWAELKKLLDGENDAIGYDFVLFAAIIRAFGENALDQIAPAQTSVE